MVERGGADFTTTEPEPTRVWCPRVMSPSTLAPEPTTTCSSSVGCRLPRLRLVPPSVTPW